MSNNDAFYIPTSNNQNQSSIPHTNVNPQSQFTGQNVPANNSGHTGQSSFSGQSPLTFHTGQTNYSYTQGQVPYTSQTGQMSYTGQTSQSSYTGQQPNLGPNQYTGTNIINPNTSFPSVSPISMTTGVKYRGMPGCLKCGGSGYKISKKKGGKQKPCKLCMKSLNYCPKCNNSGFKLKDGKACKCKKK